MRNNLNEIFEQARKNQSANVEAAIESQAVSNTPSPLSFVTPTEFVDLPSCGKFYQEGHPLKDAESVEIKQMTAKEEDILTNKSLIKKGLVIDRLIESLLINKNINVDTMLVGDKNAIIAAARISAYGPNYPALILCQSCGSKNTVQIDLTKITSKNTEYILDEIKNNPALSHIQVKNGNIFMELPKTKWIVECKLISGAEEKRLVDFLEKKRKSDPAAEISISEQLALIIVSVNLLGDNDTVLNAINAMPASDAKFLRDNYQKLIPNIKLLQKLTCSSCAEEQELEVPFTQEFFWPR